MLKTVVLDIN